MPEQQEFLEKNRIILYISMGDCKPIIWPNFVGQELTAVTTFLEQYTIKPYIIYDTVPSSHTREHTVTDQRPLAGTLLRLNDEKQLSVQLRVQ